MSDKPSVGAVILGIPTLLALGFGSSFLWALVVQDLWKWFVMSHWTTAPLPFWNACGLLLMLSAVRVGLQTSKMDDDDASWVSRSVYPISVQVTTALFTWGFGYLYAMWGHLL